MSNRLGFNTDVKVGTETTEQGIVATSSRKQEVGSVGLKHETNYVADPKVVGNENDTAAYEGGSSGNFPQREVVVGEEKTASVIDLKKEAERKEKLERIAFLKKQLKETDYRAIKFAEGEMSVEEYEPYKTERKVWREEINKLETELQ